MRLILALMVAVVLASGCIGNNETANDMEEPPTPDGDSPETDTSAPAEEESESTTVTFTGSGFQPADVTIEQGETVNFVNEGDTTMWIGSDRHPTHTNYAGTNVREHCQNGDQTSAAFDQCSTGDRFSFTFEKTGEWSYHNHQPFVQGGTISVE